MRLALLAQSYTVLISPSLWVMSISHTYQERSKLSVRDSKQQVCVESQLESEGYDWLEQRERRQFLASDNESDNLRKRNRELSWSGFGRRKLATPPWKRTNGFEWSCPLVLTETEGDKRDSSRYFW